MPRTEMIILDSLLILPFSWTSSMNPYLTKCVADSTASSLDAIVVKSSSHSTACIAPSVYSCVRITRPEGLCRSCNGRRATPCVWSIASVEDEAKRAVPGPPTPVWEPDPVEEPEDPTSGRGTRFGARPANRRKSISMTWREAKSSSSAGRRSRWRSFMQMGCEAKTLRSCCCEMPFLETKRSRLAGRTGSADLVEQEGEEEFRRRKKNVHVETFGRTHVNAPVFEDDRARVGGVLDKASIHEVLAHLLGHLPAHRKRRRRRCRHDPQWVPRVRRTVRLGELERGEVEAGLVAAVGGGVRGRPR